jgi:tRNA threonylcarbamoyladenosine biosynthesis protein TsaE|tara:strand:- start:1768 stop:2217 length:450 start_codon:yes stop_codon:yes gene_type:complete
MKTKIIKSKSAQETLMIGEKIASELKGNEIILLFGELGSGKTTLSQGLIKGLGYEGWPRSPSFVIVKEYEVKYKIQHMDFYRLDNLASLLGFGIEDYLNMHSVKIIEWPEISMELINKEYIKINISKTKNNDSRTINISSVGNINFNIE